MIVDKVQPGWIVVPHPPPSTPAAIFTASIGVDEPDIFLPNRPNDPIKTSIMAHKFEAIFLLTSQGENKALEGI